MRARSTLVAMLTAAALIAGAPIAGAATNKTGNYGCAGKFGKISFTQASNWGRLYLKAPGATRYAFYPYQSATNIADVSGGGGWGVQAVGDQSSLSVGCVSYG